MYELVNPQHLPLQSVRSVTSPDIETTSKGSYTPYHPVLHPKQGKRNAKASKQPKIRDLEQWSSNHHGTAPNFLTLCQNVDDLSKLRLLQAIKLDGRIAFTEDKATQTYV